MKIARKETIQLQKTKKPIKKEWNLKSSAQDAINTLFIKKLSSILYRLSQLLGDVSTFKIAQYASLVQLVERWSPKPNVEGSSPSGRELCKISLKKENKWQILIQK